MSEQKCKDKVRGELGGRIKDLDKLFRAYQAGKEEVEDLGSFPGYGLCFDYVPKGTFWDQARGYFRYQLSCGGPFSCGGPTDEFRFFADETLEPTRIEYWFMDWFDGAHIALRPGSKEFGLMSEIWEFFKDIGSVAEELKKAVE